MRGSINDAFRGCRERHSAPWPFQSDFAGAPTDLRERSREPRMAPTFPSFFPPYLPDDGRLATSRNTPSGVSQEAIVKRRIGGAVWPCTENTSGSRERPAPPQGENAVAMRKSATHDSRDRPARKHGTAQITEWASFGKSDAKCGSNPPRSEGTAPRGATTLPP